MRVTRTSEVPEEPNTSGLMMGGPVTAQVIIPGASANNFNCGVVNFSRGARTKFHSHTSDQLLIITAGIGMVATSDEEREVTVGDIAYIPAGEKHWHGARKESSMSHITIVAKDSQTTRLED